MKVWKNLERAMSDSFLKKIYYKNRDTLKLIWENSAHKDEPLNLVYSIHVHDDLLYRANHKHPNSPGI